MCKQFAVISLSLHFCIISKNSFWVSLGKTGSRCIKELWRMATICAPSVFLKSGTTLVDKVFANVLITSLGEWLNVCVFCPRRVSSSQSTQQRLWWSIRREFVLELTLSHCIIRVFGITGESCSLFVVCTLAKVTPKSDDDEVVMMMMCLDG